MVNNADAHEEIEDRLQRHLQRGPTNHVDIWYTRRTLVRLYNGGAEFQPHDFTSTKFREHL